MSEIKTLSNEELDRFRVEARKRVLHKKGFYIHLVCYVGISIILFVTSKAIGGIAGFWIMFSILPLTLGILIHYVSVFGFPLSHVMTKHWEEEEMEKEMGRLLSKKGYELKDLLTEEKSDQLDLDKVPPKSPLSAESDFV